MTKDGIELYATDTVCGMSQSGLARFCGVGEAKIRQILESIARLSVTSECLKPFAGKDLSFALQMPTGGTVNVIPSDLCAAFCEYYAFESKASNETARFSYRKFAKLGIDSWIRLATGHVQPVAMQLTPEQLTIQLLLENKALNELQLETQTRLTLASEKLTLTTEKLLDQQQYLTKATINAPGLQHLLESAQDIDGLCLPAAEDKELYTLLEWLEQVKGITIPDKMYRQFRLKVAGFFETMRHYTPKKETRISPKGNSCQAYVYSKSDFFFLNTVLAQVTAAYTP